jgi:hypothetical protein
MAAAGCSEVKKAASSLKLLATSFVLSLRPDSREHWPRILGTRVLNKMRLEASS